MSIGDKTDPRAYIRLALELQKQIEEGKLPAGSPTPSITTLTQDHGHARQTCAKALRLLVEAGLVIRYPGLGYYVAGNPGDPTPENPAKGSADGD
jgi:DNA-binding GntR family transcriptional regulator